MTNPADQPAADASAAVPAAPPQRVTRPLRVEISALQAVLWGVACVCVCLGLWSFLTYGPAEERILSRSQLPSPQETFESFPSLWFERALTRNLFVSLRRVGLGFALAIAAGVPLGVLCGCFSRLQAFFAPLALFGRNAPIAALIPLTFALFGIGELQKVMFIFVACVAFVWSDTAAAIADVSGQYIDTAYTLGASRRQTILRVLVPLALPNICNSLRLLFGLAFGYIMLAEVVKFGSEAGGLGDLIITSQRRGPREHVYLVLLVIPLVALALDRCFFWLQRELFPYRYGGHGLLLAVVRVLLNGWEDLKLSLLGAAEPPAAIAGPGAAPAPPDAETAQKESAR